MPRTDAVLPRKRSFPWIHANVIACALWLGYPALARSLNPSKCPDNLRLMSTAIGIYSIDNDDMLPLAHNWGDATLPYMPGKSSYICPDLEGNQANRFGHAYSTEVAGKNSIAVEEAQRPIVFDSTDISWNASGKPNPAKDGRGDAAYLDGSVRALSK